MKFMADKTLINVASLPLQDEDSISSLYCNNVNLALTPWDFRFVFSEIIVQSGGKPINVAKASVVMAPAHAKALLGALEANLKGWEAVYGEIKMPKPPKPQKKNVN
jgi:hypothetical protein